jgi:hypothetical protein
LLRLDFLLEPFPDFELVVFVAEVFVPALELDAVEWVVVDEDDECVVDVEAEPELPLVVFPDFLCVGV